MIFTTKRTRDGAIRRRPQLEPGSQVHAGPFGPRTPRLTDWPTAPALAGATGETGLASGRRGRAHRPRPPAALAGNRGPRPPNGRERQGRPRYVLHVARVTPVSAQTLLPPPVRAAPGARGLRVMSQPGRGGARGPRTDGLDAP